MKKTFLAGVFLLLLFIPALSFGADAYSLADLAGQWHGYGLASGAGAPWWEMGAGVINADGSFSFNTTYSGESPDTVTGTFSISADGIVTLAGNSILRCTLDAGKTFMACTDTWTSGSPGSTEMKVLIKMGTSYSLADLAGVWENNALASGSGAPWWNRGPITINADGSFSGTLEEYPNESDTWSGNFTMTADGVITYVGHPSGGCAMDASKTVIVCAATWSQGSPGTTELRIMTKKAASYVQADLAGTWEVNDLASGPGAPWWARGPSQINSAGSATTTLTYSDNGGETANSTFSISTDGVISQSINATQRCTMNSTKNVVACTSTWLAGYPGTTEMTVFTKKNVIGPCTYTLSPGNYGFTPSANTRTVAVTCSAASCAWTAASNDSWLAITSGASGTGSGTVAYSVAANATGSARNGTLTVAGSTVTIRQAGATFADVPDNVFKPYIYAIYTEGITVGCGSGNYCPSSNVTRGQMAAFIIRALYGETFSYTATPYYSDVPSGHNFFKYVQKMKDMGITTTTGTYMVDDFVTREQMAAFIIRAKYGETFSYTATPYYSDVASTSVFYKYVQKMKDDAITTTVGTYMASSNVTREQMAAFLGRAFLGMQ